jgi:hypothetical protein
MGHPEFLLIIELKMLNSMRAIEGRLPVECRRMDMPRQDASASVVAYVATAIARFISFEVGNLIEAP